MHIILTVRDNGYGKYKRKSIMIFFIDTNSENRSLFVINKYEKSDKTELDQWVGTYVMYVMMRQTVVNTHTTIYLPSRAFAESCYAKLVHCSKYS